MTDHAGPHAGQAAKGTTAKFKESSKQIVTRSTKVLEWREKKDRRQRARLKERAFKEVDSVMETLGLSLEETTAGTLGAMTSVEMLQAARGIFPPTSSSVSLAASEAGSAVSERAGVSAGGFGEPRAAFHRSSTSSLSQGMREASPGSQVSPGVSWASVARASHHQRASSSSAVPPAANKSQSAAQPIGISPTISRESLSSGRGGRGAGAKGRLERPRRPPSHHQSSISFQEALTTQTNPRAVSRTESSPVLSPDHLGSKDQRRGQASSSSGAPPVLHPQAFAGTSHWDKLVQERASWQRRMTDVLEGKLEDIETLIQENLSRAEDLAQQLVVLETPPSGVKELDARIDWLVDATKTGKSILGDLGVHRDLLKQWWRDEVAQERRKPKGKDVSLASPHDRVCLLVAPEFVSVCHLFTSVCADIIIAVTTEEEAKAAGKVANKLIGAAKLVSNFLREKCDSPSTSAIMMTLDKKLSDHCMAVTSASADCSAQVAESLFAPNSLLAGQQSRHQSGEERTAAAAARLAHETSARCKLLQTLWKFSGELSHRISRQWPQSRACLDKRLLSSIYQATECALHMITAWLPSSSSNHEQAASWDVEDALDTDEDVDVDVDVEDEGADVRAGPRMHLTDEHVQSHAWVPGLLLTLLERAHFLHRFVREELLLVSTTTLNPASSGGVPSRTTSPKPIVQSLSQNLQESAADTALAVVSEDEATFAMLDALQASFGRLAIANTTRTALLLSKPAPLSYFALEILRDQAEQALRFVRKYDDSSLGLADLLTDEAFEREAALLFKLLRESTDQVVNGLLRVKSLLKMRKADEEVEAIPSRVRIPEKSVDPAVLSLNASIAAQTEPSALFSLAPIKEVSSSEVKLGPISPRFSGKPSFSEVLKQSPLSPPLAALPSLPKPAFPLPNLASKPPSGKPSPFAMGNMQEAVRITLNEQQPAPKSPPLIKGNEKPPTTAKRASPFELAIATNLVANAAPPLHLPLGLSPIVTLPLPSPLDNETSSVTTPPPPPSNSTVPSYGSNVMSLSSQIVGFDHGLFAIKWAEIKDDLQEMIGSGSYGHVYRARWMHDDVAVKVVSIDRDKEFDAQAIERFRQEVEIQRRLSHSNIVSFRGACCEYAQSSKVSDEGGGSSSLGLPPAGGSGEGHENSGSFTGSSVNRPPHSSRSAMLAIVMEYCHLGTLFKLISKAREVEKKLSQGWQPDARAVKSDWYRFYSSWERRLEIASGVAAGLEFMHYHSIVHRDLTSYNVLINRGWMPGSFVAKICDFNLSKVLPSERLLTKSVGLANSPAWSSPEVLNGANYGFPHDVFAFGYILWEILTLRVPWSDDDKNPGGKSNDVRVALAIESVIQGDRLPLPDPQQMNSPSGLPSSTASCLVEVIKGCWNHDPRLRPTMKIVASKVAMSLDQVKRRAKEEKTARS